MYKFKSLAEFNLARIASFYDRDPQSSNYEDERIWFEMTETFDDWEERLDAIHSGNYIVQGHK